MGAEPWILGVNASHNGAACLLHGSRPVVAVQEERLTRVKRTRIFAGLPSLAASYCLNHAGIGIHDLQCVVICSRPARHTAEHDPEQNPQFEPLRSRGRLLALSHHLGHAYSAIAWSGYDRAAVLVVDGVGSPLADLNVEERKAIVGDSAGTYEAVSLYSATGLSNPKLAVTPIEKQMSRSWLEQGYETADHMPRFESLGGLYSAAAQQIFGNARHAGKVMGLAPYGKPRIATREFLDITPDAHIRYRDEVCRRFTNTERWPAQHARYADLAASAQASIELAVLKLVARLRERCPYTKLCYAGGVALNCVLNERIIRESGYDEVFVVPAAEDSGTAVGAAYYGLQWLLDHEPTSPTMRRTQLRRDSLGSSYNAAAINQSVREVALSVAPHRDALNEAASRIERGEIIGWFQGGAELGPRALGQRSILCDPRQADAKERLNSAIKRREWFRPFAASVLQEHAERWFEWGASKPLSPFMLRICKVAADRRARVPAVVHSDGTSRIQTVSRDVCPRFHAIIERFYDNTGVPLLLNTSLNVRGEPLVETPQDALVCLLTSGLDACVLDDVVIGRPDNLTSPLDLAFMLSDRVQSMQLQPRDDADALDLLSGAAVQLSICLQTPWGSLVRGFPERWADILEHTTTARSGHLLLADVTAAWQREVPPPELADVLIELCRAGVLRPIYAAR